MLLRAKNEDLPPNENKLWQRLQHTLSRSELPPHATHQFYMQGHTKLRTATPLRSTVAQGLCKNTNRPSGLVYDLKSTRRSGYAKACLGPRAVRVDISRLCYNKKE